MHDTRFRKFPHYPHYSSFTSKPRPIPSPLRDPAPAGRRLPPWPRRGPPLVLPSAAASRHGHAEGLRRCPRWSPPPAMAAPRTSAAASRTCCQLLLRIKAPDSGDAKVDLGLKYGAHPEEVLPLLRAAQREGLTVAGVSFHVGSGASRTDVYRGAIEAARGVFDAAAALGMPPMRILDIGGGFIAGTTFDEAAVVINHALARYFGDLPCVDVIGEPGRYFAETAFTLAARVIGKRTRGELREYWIDDGLYGSLNCILMDYYVPRPRPLAGTRPGEKTHASTVFGPTCDSLDTVTTGYQLPEMSVGDWLVFDDMGAYTTAAGSNFNGFATSAIKIYLAYSS